MKLKRYSFLFWLMLLAWGPVSVAFGDDAISSWTPGTAGANSNNSTLGWRFHLNTAVTLKALGVFDTQQDGFIGSHEVGLWTSGGTLLGDGLLNAGTSGTLSGNFRYVNVPNVSLPVGDYVIGANFGNNADLFAQDNPSLTTNPFLTYQGRNASPLNFGFGFPLTALGADGLNFITSSFQFGPIPEPTSFVLVVLGFISLSAMRSSSLQRRRK